MNVDNIDRELDDMYRAYRTRLSDQAVETIMAIKPMIEFYDDEANMLLDSLSANVRRMFPALKTGDIYIIIYMAVYETLLSEDELYVYPSLALYNQNIVEKKKLMERYELTKVEMDKFQSIEVESDEPDVIEIEENDLFQNVYFEYNLAKGELEENAEQGKMIKKRFELHLKRRNMLEEALRESLSRVLLDELQL